MTCISLFSGIGGLESGFRDFGIKTKATCDNSVPAPFHGVTHYDSLTTIPGDVRADIICGGPPCQSFSTAGKRKGINDPRGELLFDFVHFAVERDPKFIVLENVRGLLSSGYTIESVCAVLNKSRYSVSGQLYDASLFGAPQVRERVILIGVKDDRPMPLLMPTHSAPVTVRSVIGDTGIDGPFIRPSESLRALMDLVPEGGNWRSLPADIARTYLGNAFGNGGGNAGFLRRIHRDKPSPTLLTSPLMKSTLLWSPTESRPLTVPEYEAIMELKLPDSVRALSVAAQYRALGNAVPLRLSIAVASTICDRVRGRDNDPPSGTRYSRYKTEPIFRPR